VRIVVAGNSGSGKSTLAKRLSRGHLLAHLDLDTLAWLPGPVRRPLEESNAKIAQFIAACPDWVIEGCYADLLAAALPYATLLAFLNPGVEACIANARARPFEPHKYASKEAQDANLAMLERWIREYETRADELSLRAHRQLFDAFRGGKIELTTRAQIAAFEP